MNSIVPLDIAKTTREYTVVLKVVNNPNKARPLYINRAFTLIVQETEKASLQHILSRVSDLLQQMMDAPALSVTTDDLVKLQQEVVTFARGETAPANLRERQERLFIQQTLFDAVKLKIGCAVPPLMDQAPLFDVEALLQKAPNLVSAAEIDVVKQLRHALFLQRKLFVCQSKIVDLLFSQAMHEKEILQTGGQFRSCDEERLRVRTPLVEGGSFEELALSLQVVRLMKGIAKGQTAEQRKKHLFEEIANVKGKGLISEQSERCLLALLALQQSNWKRRKKETRLNAYILTIAEIQQHCAKNLAKQSKAGKIFSQQQQFISKIAPIMAIMDCRKVFFGTIEKLQDPQVIGEAIAHAAEKRLFFLERLRPFFKTFKECLKSDEAFYSKLEQFCTCLIAQRKAKVQLVQNLQALRISEKKITALTTLDFQRLLQEEPLVEPVADVQKEEVVPPVVIPEPKKALTYHWRILRWLEPDEKSDPFVHDPQYNQSRFSEKAKSWIIAQHGFAHVVDSMAERYGIRRESALYIVGEMTIRGETRKGLFVYAYDENGVCYHRYFCSKNCVDLLQEYMERGFYELDFPRLKKVPASEKTAKVFSADKSYIEQETDYVVTIQDPKNQATIRLCKLYEE